MKKKVQYKHSGGYQLKQMRERERWLQRKLAYELDIAESMISRFETGARVPNRELLEKILEKFKATPFERKNVLNAYGYRVITELPTDTEHKDVIDAVHPILNSLGIPAYLMDCSTRIVAWNHHIARAFGIDEPEKYGHHIFAPKQNHFLREFSSVPLIQTFYKAGLKERVTNWEAYRDNILLPAAYAIFWEHKETEWCQNMMEETKRLSPEFNPVWERLEGQKTTDTDTNTEPLPFPARPAHILKIQVPDKYLLTFRIASEAVTYDDRFRIIYWFPADAQTIQIIDEWSRLHQQLMTKQTA